MENSCQRILERYLKLRRASLHADSLAQYRLKILSFIQFLHEHYPDVDSFAKLRRIPHIIAWLETLKNAQPPYSNVTRRQSIYHVRRFLNDIREWNWPGSPAGRFFRSEDFPPRKCRSRSKDERRKALKERSALYGSPFYGVVQRYLDIRSTNLTAGAVKHYRKDILAFIEFLLTRFPEIDSFAKLKRTPHIEEWLHMLVNARPPYKERSRDAFIFNVRRFFKDIRKWNWPGSPPADLFRLDDFSTHRPRATHRPRTRLDFPAQENFLHKVLKRYIDIRSATLRPATIRHYRFSGLSLIEFLRVGFPKVASFVELRRAPHIEGWLQRLAKKQPAYRNGTRRDLIRHVRRFLEDIREWGWSESPPAELIRPLDFPPADRYLPKPLPPDVDVALVGELKKRGDDVSLGLVLARRSGLRVGELCRLELDCVTENPQGHFSLRVPLGKLRSERVVPIDAETATIVKTIQGRRGELPPSVDPETGRTVALLFASIGKTSSLYRTFSRRLKATAESIGITHNVHPHRLRHTYATELLRNGVSLAGVMKLLGHRNLKMTLRYVEVTNEDLGRDYLKAIERAQNQYARLKYVSNQDVGDHPDALEAIVAAFDQLVARIQAVRFDHPDPGRRKKLQRLVERLRRAQSGLPDLSE